MFQPSRSSKRRLKIQFLFQNKKGIKRMTADDCARITYTYKIRPTIDHDVCAILNASTDIYINLEGNPLHFAFFQRPRETFGTTSGIIRPSQTMGSSFSYGSNQSPQSYSVETFMKMCKTNSIDEIFVTSTHRCSISPIHTDTTFDYPKSISHLQYKGVVKTKPSKSFLTTDGRVFSIVSKSKVVVGCTTPDSDLKDYTGKWFEVDCLGSSLHSNLTNFVETLVNLTSQ